ncbi:hypothetical protein [Aquipseudomonas guryensis]|uniref:B box-type domain-containing protein n=1 Tax=Aquipseudomonas guryensis TaxID=2759165 RepID=A0A7W4DBK7_9GAMM|nr:hypothetical protein [Pseudomonas guryensis]MBB1519555.1 hypothetical protein [Pseudomonas guryensis]
MQCFNHPKEAIGICKHCQRALCVDCCTDLKDGLACKGVHEAEVTHLNSLLQNTKKAYSSSPTASLFGPIFNIFTGLAFIIFGIQSSSSNFLIVLGAGFFTFGLAIIIYNTKYFKKITTNYDA